MLQRLSSGHIVWKTENSVCGSLSPDVLAMLARWAQQRFCSKEAGGLILGFIDNDTNGLLAEELTVPGQRDKRSKTSFFRSDRHQLEAELWNKKTGGRGTQLGLWHTHPEANPSPSKVDLNDCQNVMKTGTFDSDGLLYLIVGTQTVGCWYACKTLPLSHLGHFKL